MKAKNGWFKFGTCDVRASFRVLHIPKREVARWDSVFGDMVDKPIKTCRRDGGYFLCVQLTSRTFARKLMQKLALINPDDSYCERNMSVSVVSDRPSVDIVLPGFIMEFYKNVGGSFDLSFIAFREEDER